MFNPGLNQGKSFRKRKHLGKSKISATSFYSSDTKSDGNLALGEYTSLNTSNDWMSLKKACLLRKDIEPKKNIGRPPLPKYIMPPKIPKPKPKYEYTTPTNPDAFIFKSSNPIISNIESIIDKNKGDNIAPELLLDSSPSTTNNLISDFNSLLSTSPSPIKSVKSSPLKNSFKSASTSDVLNDEPLEEIISSNEKSETRLPHNDQKKEDRGDLKNSNQSDSRKKESGALLSDIGSLIGKEPVKDMELEKIIEKNKVTKINKQSTVSQLKLLLDSSDSDSSDVSRDNFDNYDNDDFVNPDIDNDNNLAVSKTESAEIKTQEKPSSEDKGEIINSNHSSPARSQLFPKLARIAQSPKLIASDSSSSESDFDFMGNTKKDTVPISRLKSPSILTNDISESDESDDMNFFNASAKDILADSPLKSRDLKNDTNTSPDALILATPRLAGKKEENIIIANKTSHDNNNDKDVDMLSDMSVLSPIAETGDSASDYKTAHDSPISSSSIEEINSSVIGPPKIQRSLGLSNGRIQFLSQDYKKTENISLDSDSDSNDKDTKTNSIGKLNSKRKSPEKKEDFKISKSFVKMELSDNEAENEDEDDDDEEDGTDDILQSILRKRPEKKIFGDFSTTPRAFDMLELRKRRLQIPNFIALKLPAAYDDKLFQTHSFFEEDQNLQKSDAEADNKEAGGKDNDEHIEKFNKRFFNFNNADEIWEDADDLFANFDKLTELSSLDLTVFPEKESQGHELTITRSKLETKYEALKKWISVNKNDTAKILKILSIYAIDSEFNKEVRNYKYSTFQVLRHVQRAVPHIKHYESNKPAYETFFEYIKGFNEFHQYKILQKFQFLKRIFFEHQYNNDIYVWVKHIKTLVDYEHDTKYIYKGASLYELLKFVTLLDLIGLEYVHDFLIKKCGDGFSTNNIENALIMQYLNIYIQKRSLVEENPHSVFGSESESEPESEPEPESESDMEY